MPSGKGSCLWEASYILLIRTRSVGYLRIFFHFFASDFPACLHQLSLVHPPDEMRALARDDVRVLGWVPELDYLYEHARVFVAPLRFGAGMKGKIG